MAYVNQSRVGTSLISDRFNAVLKMIRAHSARRRIYAQTVRELSNLSDRDLADLGISRFAIRDIAIEAAYGK
jgi:uncharacterized protein YjiS (DUF1127 family)